jgi:hypothetical protein
MAGAHFVPAAIGMREIPGFIHVPCSSVRDFG